LEAGITTFVSLQVCGVVDLHSRPVWSEVGCCGWARM
jgi:hypothetical protein